MGALAIAVGATGLPERELALPVGAGVRVRAIGVARAGRAGVRDAVVARAMPVQKAVVAGLHLAKSGLTVVVEALAVRAAGCPEALLPTVGHAHRGVAQHAVHAA